MGGGGGGYMASFDPEDDSIRTISRIHKQSTTPLYHFDQHNDQIICLCDSKSNFFDFYFKFIIHCPVISYKYIDFYILLWLYDPAEMRKKAA